MYAIRSYYDWRDLADGLYEWRKIFKADKTTAQNAEDQHDNGTCIGNLCRCTGKGCDQHPPACRTEDRRKDQDDDSERIAPSDLKEQGRCEDQYADLRITSYNVCYTKLLRGCCLQIQIVQVKLKKPITLR